MFEALAGDAYPYSQEAIQSHVELPNALGISGPITPDEFKQRISELSEEAFKLWLLTINASVRDIAPEMHDFDGGGHIEGFFGIMPNAGFKLYCPPEPEDRVPLLIEGFHIAQGVNNPVRAGAVLSVAVNFAHASGDGNGRTGRLVCARNYGLRW